MNKEVQVVLAKGCLAAKRTYEVIEFAAKHVIAPTAILAGRSLVGSLRLTHNSIIKPSARVLGDQLDKPMPRMTRRTFLLGLFSSAVTGYFARPYIEDQLNQLAGDVESKTPNRQETAKPEPTITEDDLKIEQKGSFYEPFAGNEANKIAKEMGVTAGTFFVVSKEVIPSLQAFLGNELLPIYTPGVLRWKDQIYKYANLYNIPPNILAMIMTIESAGRQNAVSGVNAQGLMQVMPNNFPINLRNEKNMQDPDNNIKYGCEVFNNFLTYARNSYSDLKLNDPRTFARALMGYNGGWAAVDGTIIPTTVGGTKVPPESAYYGDHVIRFVLTSEIASRLRKLGLSDPEIVKQLQSEEINARAYALEKYGFADYFTYTPIAGILSNPIIEDNNLKQYYDEYKSDEGKRYNYPASPALEIWMRINGFVLVSQEKLYSQNIQNWVNMNSRKQ